MRKTHIGETKTIAEITDSIFCNMCGKKIGTVKGFGTEPHDVFEDVLHIHKTWVDGLRITGDADQKYSRTRKSYTLDICRDCFEIRIVKGCAIPPEEGEL